MLSFMRNPVLIVFLLSLSQVLNAQTDYLVTLKGDTIRGPVKILSFERLDRAEIKYDGKKKSFTALEARTVFSKNELYQTVSMNNEGFRYMKVVKSGYLSLYNFRLPNQTAYTGLYLAKKTGVGLEVPNLTYRKTLAEFLSDCPDLSDQIKAGNYPKTELEKLIDAYNSCQGKPAKTIEVQPVAASNSLIASVDDLIKKVEGLNFEKQKDALDILKDIRNKSGRNESIPNYLTEGLKAALQGQSALTGDLDKVMSLLQK